RTGVSGAPPGLAPGVVSRLGSQIVSSCWFFFCHEFTNDLYFIRAFVAICSCFQNYRGKLPRKFLAFFKKVLRELEHKKEIRSWGKEQMQFLRERECEKGAKG